MKRLSLSVLTIAAVLLSPYARADGAEEEEPPSTEAVTTAPENEEDIEEGVPVSKGSGDPERNAKRRMWQNIIIATSAVVVAVTALVLVSSNQGHKS